MLLPHSTKVETLTNRLDELKGQNGRIARAERSSLKRERNIHNRQIKKLNKLSTVADAKKVDSIARARTKAKGLFDTYAAKRAARGGKILRSFKRARRIVFKGLALLIVADTVGHVAIWFSDDGAPRWSPGYDIVVDYGPEKWEDLQTFYNDLIADKEEGAETHEELFDYYSDEDLEEAAEDEE